MPKALKRAVGLLSSVVPKVDVIRMCYSIKDKF